jgi:hypothetical protein
LKTISYVLQQMVNVHEQWVDVKEKENRRRWWRVSLTASAANWISDYVSVWLSGLNERRASKKANEWTRAFGWSSGLALYARTRLRLSHSTLAESTTKNKNAATNFFLFSYVIVFFSTLSVHICMRTGSISWPWTMTTAFTFFFFFSTSYVWFYVQYKYKKRKRIREKSI